ncbi:MAG: hypothetical protein IJ233_04050, partial [Pyramidobacter sp.]|nr:hypothetical protein [Pyramidobacter sp.]
NSKKERLKEGITRRVNLDKLIKNVYVSPDAPTYVLEIVIDLINKYGYIFRANRSALVDKLF